MRFVKDQRGVALPLALIGLVSLSGLLLVFLHLGATESLIGKSHAELTEARFVAEAGIEWAYDNLISNPDWNAVLLGPDGLADTADDGKLATAVSLPGLSAASGTFTVTVRNDAQAGDSRITGAPLDTGGGFNDTNGRIIVTSVGVVGAATRTVRVAMRRITLPPLVAALALPGAESETTFNGNSFTVNGTDTNLDDTPGPGDPVWGIAVGAGNTANETVVQNSLSAQQQNNVTGKAQNQGQPGSGNNAISPDPQLTSPAVSDFITSVKSSADLTMVSTQANPLSFTNIGASCASNPGSTTCWGTQANPKIVYIKGEPDPTSAFSALQVSGNSSGTGILIVEDGDLRISGNFRWNGIIIVTGKWVGIGYMGGGWQSVYGAVISNETATDPGFREALVSGNAKINYSTQAIGLAGQIRKLVTLTSWGEL
ncbi:MAG: hypothetical protein HY725_18755 [Candidatus Rokubacteria bacterium]|nr:hypothetical protein [Candidatus Rokubacteria bacterium]